MQISEIANCLLRRGPLASGKFRLMRLGINTFLFTSPFTNRSTSLFGRFKKWGFETVEIPVEDPSHIDPAHVKAQLDRRATIPTRRRIP
jgi:hypothetical protein